MRLLRWLLRRPEPLRSDVVKAFGLAHPPTLNLPAIKPLKAKRVESEFERFLKRAQR